MQKHPLSGKVALVTGGARRIGAEIARTLHQAGLNVALHYNVSEEEAVLLCEELNQQRNNSSIVIQGDLGEPGCEKLIIQKAAAAWNRLDVLVNNASRFYSTPIGEVTDFSWNDLIASNLKGPFFLTQAAAPYLIATEGCVVNITDIHAERPLKNYSVYCISKSGLLMMTKVLANELGPSVRVNAVAPGPIMWPEGQSAFSDTEKQKIIDQTLLERSGAPEDIAKAVLYFVRDGAYVTGQVLNIDGGRGVSF